MKPNTRRPVPKHPFLADSSYTTGHVNVAIALNTPAIGFGDIGRPLSADEISWLPAGGYITSIRYSGVYPDGRRVAWTGGGSLLYKYDADSRAVLAETEVLPIGIRMTAEAVRRHVDRIDSLSGKEQLAVAIPPISTDLAPVVYTIYHNFVSNENEQYLGVNDLANKRIQLRVYGDAVEGDPASAIALRRELTLPDADPFKAMLFSISMTFDGTVLAMLTDGTLFAISRDLKLLDRISLAHDPINATPGAAGKDNETLNLFVRNVLSLDDDGGIYILPRDYLHRVQWTGKKFSRDEADGAWRVAYDSGPRGSGTSPNMMGWGDDEDKLIILSSGTEPYVMAYWRDKIPHDWKGLPGEDRRLAARAPAYYGDEYHAKGSIKEFTNAVKGYGVFFGNDMAVGNYARDVGFVSTAEGGGYASMDEFLAFAFGVGKKPEYTPRAGLKLEWNPRSRSFDHQWRTQRSFATMLPIIDGNDVLYYIGTENGVWTLEGIDWNTGQLKFKYELGSSQRFNPVGTALEIAPNGALDCPCGGGLGWVRVLPKPAAAPAS
ncbi:MAG: hypothetical protein JWQ90_2490 [Hydrocarboniphaga sp.]|uniref:hypothetical protein n=1 Tax=Hydrocarboniphaga sp. TaxID=2033016 RepID=UPI0026172588|nr:hypothetical protein [Hydrocarboniphaga sp.]MDB5970040.1 hypothetical protein [Hydrocarboniphaga sp.]